MICLTNVLSMVARSMCSFLACKFPLIGSSRCRSHTLFWCNLSARPCASKSVCIVLLTRTDSADDCSRILILIIVHEAIKYRPSRHLFIQLASFGHFELHYSSVLDSANEASFSNVKNTYLTLNFGHHRSPRTFPAK
jgi:hypothetical protein